MEGIKIARNYYKSTIATRKINKVFTVDSANYIIAHVVRAIKRLSEKTFEVFGTSFVYFPKFFSAIACTTLSALEGGFFDQKSEIFCYSNGDQKEQTCSIVRIKSRMTVVFVVW